MHFGSLMLGRVWLSSTHTSNGEKH
jgi:hypothetical protein